MTKNEFAAKLNENVDIKALAAEIDGAENDDAVLEILKRYNVELTPEEIRSLNEQDGELDEDALEAVAGGCKCKGILKRAITNFLFWITEKATGKKITCLECGY